MIKNISKSLILCGFFLLLAQSCRKDARCTCVYVEENLNTNAITRDTFSKKIHERKNAQKKACESPNFKGNDKDKNLNYETKCWLN